jgi:archaellum component FlaC
VTWLIWGLIHSCNEEMRREYRKSNEERKKENRENNEERKTDNREVLLNIQRIEERVREIQNELTELNDAERTSEKFRKAIGELAQNFERVKAEVALPVGE